MFPWWDSLEALVRFNRVMQLTVTLAGVITLGAGLLVWFSAGRISELRNEREKRAQERLDAAEGVVGNLRMEVKTAYEKQEAAERALQEQSRQLQEVQTHQKWRALTAAQREHLISYLSVGPAGSVDVQIIANEEADNFALSLVAVFEAAGWSVTSLGTTINQPIPPGLTIMMPTMHEAPEYGFVLLNALKTAGISFNVAFNPSRPAGSLTVFVGHKPPPP